MTATKMGEIMQNAVLIRVSFGGMGSTRKADMGKVDAGNTDKTMLHMNKTLFESESYDAIFRLDSEVKGWLFNRTINVNLGFDGLYILPLSLLTEVDDKLNRRLEERNGMVMKFLDEYDAAKDQARSRLGDQFNDLDYPSRTEAERRFFMRWRYVQFTVPENLPAGVLAREQEKLEAQMNQMAEDARLALREGMSGLIQHLVERLTPDESGKRKVFRDSVVGNLVDFLELFSKRNITNDAELATLARKARAIIASATPYTLREKDATRQYVAREMAKVNEAVTTMIAQQRKRKFDLG